MRNPFLLGLFDSLTHTDHHATPLDVRTVLREHGGLQAFQSTADPDRWLAVVEHDMDERIRGRDQWIRDYMNGMRTATILKILLPPLFLVRIAVGNPYGKEPSWLMDGTGHASRRERRKADNSPKKPV